QLQRFGQRLNGARMIAERDEAPALFDERGRADVIGVQDRALPRELRRGSSLRIGGELLVAIDQLADVFLQLRQLTELPVDLLEERDDLALGGFALGIAGRAVEQPGDLVVL